MMYTIVARTSARLRRQVPWRRRNRPSAPGGESVPLRLFCCAMARVCRSALKNRYAIVAVTDGSHGVMHPNASCQRFLSFREAVLKTPASKSAVG